MATFNHWFQKAVTKFLDPDRETRVNTLVSSINHGIQVQGQQFSLKQMVAGLQGAESDLREAKERVYRAALERGWSDGLLTAAEQKIAGWLASRLELSNEEARKLDLEQARKWFGFALAQAMDDGVLDQQEEVRLQTIAAAVGSSLPAFARAFFHCEGEAFLRSIFLACVADNHISQSDWDYLLHVTQKLGLQHDEMLAAVQPQACQFVEHVLTDAKSDGMISAHEQQTLQWLLNNLRLPADVRAYVLDEVRLIQTLTAIDDGKLPSVAMPTGMEHRAGEIVHWIGNATWREHRMRKDGLHAFNHQGVLAITDNRLIFSGGMKSQTVGHRKVVVHRGTNAWLEVQMEGKSISQYFFEVPSPIPYAIFRTAVAMANQTKVAKLEGGFTRHIPREVRQRVWQRYGGRCAKCSATTYLEFDHIIPVARGGNSADGNVQLLCRMCNLKKSDHI